MAEDLHGGIGDSNSRTWVQGQGYRVYEIQDWGFRFQKEPNRVIAHRLLGSFSLNHLETETIDAKP